MIRIMFVDDEPAILEGLENRLRRFRKQWDVSFYSRPTHALEVLEAGDFDVVVSDMRMPGMDGAELLRHVRERHPRMTRIILSGQTSKDGVIRALPVAHQFLSKPCAIEHIKMAVDRGRNLSSVLADERIVDLVATIDQLPVLSDLHQSLVDAVEEPNVPLARLAAIIEQDVAMTARVLQVVNSAFFALGRELTAVEDAVSYLGINLIRSLILSIEIFEAFEGQASPDGFRLKALQSHSFRSACLARDLVETPDGRLTAFSAAMLHDIGRLVLSVSRPSFYDEVIPLQRERGIPLYQAEELIHGFSHAEVGAVLLASWGLPYSIVEAVAHHHHPGRAQEVTLGVVGAVHIADRIAHSQWRTSGGQSALGEELGLDMAYLADVGAVGEIEKWRLLVNDVAAAPQSFYQKEGQAHVDETQGSLCRR